MENENFESVKRITDPVDCEMPVNLNQNYIGNPPGVRNTGCALCCGIDMASFKKAKKYTLADFAGYYTIDVDAEGRECATYNWGAPDGVKFTGKMSLASLTEAQTIQKIRSYVDRGIPVACHAVGSGGQHWFVAYHADPNGGSTWETSKIYVLDPYNGDRTSIYGRFVGIWDAMALSNVKSGIDYIRLLA